MSDAIAVLAEHGLVTETGHTESTGGRPATLLDVPVEVGGVLAADVGGAQLRVCVANLRGQLVDLFEVETPSDPRELEETISRAFADMRDRLPGRVLATCIAVAGIVHPQTKAISMTSNVPGWTASSIPSWLAELDGPLMVENEANAGVFGEAQSGIAVGVRDVLFVSIGAGIGSGMIQDGRLVRGTTGAAGEIGLMVGSWSGDAASTPLERVASGPALLRHYRRCGGTATKNPVELFALAERGDAAAQEAIDRGLDALAMALTNATLMIDPQLIVLGGGLATVGDLLAKPLEQRTRRFLSTEPPPIAVCHLGAHAALRGAASLAAKSAVSRLVTTLDAKVFGSRG